MKLVTFVLILVTFIQNIFIKNLLDAESFQKDTNELFTQQKQTHRLREQTYGYQREREKG